MQITVYACIYIFFLLAWRSVTAAAKCNLNSWEYCTLSMEVRAKRHTVLMDDQLLEFNSCCKREILWSFHTTQFGNRSGYSSSQRKIHSWGVLLQTGRFESSICTLSDACDKTMMSAELVVFQVLGQGFQVECKKVCRLAWFWAMGSLMHSVALETRDFLQEDSHAKLPDCSHLLSWFCWMFQDCTASTNRHRNQGLKAE